MLSSRKSWSFTILFYCDFPKSWSQKGKVGVTYSKSGVNENSDVVLYITVVNADSLTIKNRNPVLFQCCLQPYPDVCREEGHWLQMPEALL